MVGEGKALIFFLTKFGFIPLGAKEVLSTYIVPPTNQRA